MGGLFGVTSKQSCTLDLFFGVDYHSHLGTVKGGMAVLDENRFTRVIHNIHNSPFRTKFEDDLQEMPGNFGIGCISDTDSQPLIIKSHLGDYALCCVGKINNADSLIEDIFKRGNIHLVSGSKGQVNSTEIVSAIIDQSDSFIEGIKRVHELVDGSMTLLLMNKDGIIAARDRLGRTPVIIGQKDGAMCASSESFAFLNLGYHAAAELGPGEIVLITPDAMQQLSPPGESMKICSFLWTYYGYPSSNYEGINVESMRYRCGEYLAKQDKDLGLKLDSVAGVPDSGTAHAIGYAGASNVPFARPFVKYTPTWPRSFTPKDQSQRNLIAHMKLIPVDDLIRDRELLFIDDSIVRGTQLRETVEFLYRGGAKNVHIRPACPPILFGCKYINFTRSRSEMELITRRTIQKLEGKCDNETTRKYIDPESSCCKAMVESIRKEQNFTSLRFLKLDDLVAATGLAKCKLCTYCWNGEG